MMYCTRNDSIANKDDAAKLPSTISWVQHHNTISRNRVGGNAAESSSSSSHAIETIKPQFSKLQNQRLVSEDHVWWGLARNPPSPCESPSIQPFPALSSLSSSSSSSLQSSSAEEIGDTTNAQLLDQACEIMLSTILIDHVCTPEEHIPTTNTQSDDHLAPSNRTRSAAPSIEACQATDRNHQYRQDLLTDDLRMFYEQVQISRSRRSCTTAPSRIDRKQQVFSGKRW